MFSLPKKLFFTSFLLVIFFLLATLLPTLVKAADTPASGANIGDFDTNIGNLTRRETIDAAEGGDTLIHGQAVNEFSLKTAIFNATNLIACTDDDPKYCNQKQTGVGYISSAMAALYTHPPASFVAYLADTLANAGILAKPAYAQGIGFAGLSPFLPFWKVARNIAYLVLIIVMVAIGFMIIFRMKIDPKTVISVQAALPKIILTLLIITFSYPIVGFFIDMMYLVMAIAISLMVTGMGGLGTDTASRVVELQSKYMTAGAGTLLGAVFWPFGSIALSFWELLGGAGVIATAITLVLAIPPLTAAAIPAALLIGPGIPLLILFIVFLGFLFTFIRLLMLLLNSYIQLIISLILGPILLLGEAIPGKSAFSGWLQNIIANLVVFPATAIIIMFSVYLAKTGQLPSGESALGNIWAPPFIGMFGPYGNFHALLSLGVMFLAPTLVAQIKKAFHPKPTIPMTAGTAFAPATGATQTVMGAGSQFYYFMSTAKMIPGLRNLIPGDHT